MNLNPISTSILSHTHLTLNCWHIPRHGRESDRQEEKNRQANEHFARRNSLAFGEGSSLSLRVAKTRKSNTMWHECYVWENSRTREHETRGEKKRWQKRRQTRLSSFFLDSHSLSLSRVYTKFFHRKCVSARHIRELPFIDKLVVWLGKCGKFPQFSAIAHCTHDICNLNFDVWTRSFSIQGVWQSSIIKHSIESSSAVLLCFGWTFSELVRVAEKLVFRYCSHSRLGNLRSAPSPPTLSLALWMGKLFLFSRWDVYDDDNDDDIGGDEGKTKNSRPCTETFSLDIIFLACDFCASTRRWFSSLLFSFLARRVRLIMRRETRVSMEFPGRN